MPSLILPRFQETGCTISVSAVIQRSCSPHIQLVGEARDDCSFYLITTCEPPCLDAWQPHLQTVTTLNSLMSLSDFFCACFPLETTGQILELPPLVSSEDGGLKAWGSGEQCPLPAPTFPILKECIGVQVEHGNVKEGSGRLLISIKSRKLPIRQILHFLIGWSFNGNLFVESSAATIYVCFLNFPVTQASQESCSWLPSSDFGHYLIYS